MKKNRIASCKRKTKETDIELTINLDGHGKNQIEPESLFLIICWTALPVTDFLT